VATTFGCSAIVDEIKRSHQFPNPRLCAVKRVLMRWLRYDVIVLDEVGYVPLAEIGAEFLVTSASVQQAGGKGFL
jgi:hypothetical protein